VAAFDLTVTGYGVGSWATGPTTAATTPFQVPVLA
jgi:hypothetical protein